MRLTQLQMSFTMIAELGTALMENHARMREVQCLLDLAEEWPLIYHQLRRECYNSKTNDKGAKNKKITQ